MLPRVSCFLLLLMAALCFPVPAHAYADPTGGNFLQVVIPAAAMVWGGCLIAYRRVWRLIQRLRQKAATRVCESSEIRDEMPRP